MKKLLLTAAVIFSLNTYAQINLDSGLVAYYPFTSNTLDSSGNNNHGTVYGATLTTDRFGSVNNAYNFNGTSNYIEVNDPTSGDLDMTTTSSLSISVWIKSSGNFEQEIINKRRMIGGTFYEGYRLTINKDDSTVRFMTEDINGLGEQSYGNKRVLDGKWHHIVAMRNGNLKKIKLYVDGVEDAIEISDITTGTLANSVPLCIGKVNYYNCFFNGSIDDIRMYNRVLSQAEIQQLYDPTPSADSCLVAYYPFTSNALDSSGNGNDGTIHNATLTIDRFGNANRAYSFSSVNDYISVPDNSLLRLQQSFSISIWTKIFANSFTLFRKWDSYGLDLGNSTSTSSGTNILFFMTPSTASKAIVCISNDPLPINQWVHIVGTYDGTYTKLYVNGNKISFSGSFNGTIKNNNSDLNIGSYNSKELFNGVIDEIRLYNCALDSTQIKQLYLSLPEYATKQNVFKVYPNPSNGIIALELQNKCNIQISVVNISGQMVYNKTLSNTQRTQIDLSNQPKGVYFIKVISVQGVGVQKVVIQ